MNGDEVNILTLEPIAGDDLTRFFDRCVDDVALDLIGKYLTSEIDGNLTGGKIVETEAYCEHDFAAHCHVGAPLRRKRGSEAMRLSGGRIYLYPAQGGFWCLNFTCGREGLGSAVLIRTLKPVWGLEVMRERRIEGGTDLSVEIGAYAKRLCNGPGVLWESLGCIDPKIHNGSALIDASLKLYRGENETPFPMVGSRILGNLKPESYAFSAKDWPRRYVDAEVSRSGTLDGFLSKPMNDAREYSAALLSQLKVDGELKACVCSRSSSTT